MRVDQVGRRRDSKQQDGNKTAEMPNVMNQMMMSNMYPQGKYIFSICKLVW